MAKQDPQPAASSTGPQFSFDSKVTNPTAFSIGPENEKAVEPTKELSTRYNTAERKRAAALGFAPVAPIMDFIDTPKVEFEGKVETTADATE